MFSLQTLVNKYSPDEIVPEEEYEALLKEIENTLQAKKIEVFTGKFLLTSCFILIIKHILNNFLFFS